MLPGEIEANGGKLSAKYGGLLFTEKEMAEFAAEAKVQYNQSMNFPPPHVPVDLTFAELFCMFDRQLK